MPPICHSWHDALGRSGRERTGHWSSRDVETRVSVVAACLICLWVCCCMCKPSCCRCRCNRGLNAESQRTLRDVTESGRLLCRGDPEYNIATSTLDGLWAETLKRYFRDTKKRVPCVIGCFVCWRKVKEIKTKMETATANCTNTALVYV